MNAYKKAVKKHLRCRGARKKELMAQFDASLSAFVEEQDSPTYDQMVAAFGPPDVMAQVLMEQVPNDEILQYKKQGRFLKCLACILAVGYLVFALYTFYWKELTIITVEAETFEGTIATFQEGD